MNKIYIKSTPNSDTRSLKELDKNLVIKDTLLHIKAVKSVMNELADELKRNAVIHDYTKITYRNEFFEAISTGKTGEEFYKLDWWKLHLTERHHLNQCEPEDVNLLDILEMIVDCVCAGKARTGEMFSVNLSNELLQRAVNNTIKMLNENVEVIDNITEE